MNIGLFNTRGINKTEHFIPLELQELKKRNIDTKLYWVKGEHPTREEAKSMDFAVYHFVPTALHFRRMGIPYCILPTANDIFPDDGEKLKILDKDKNCKFIGYQSFYHKRKYDEWGITKPTVYVPHCVRTDLFVPTYGKNGGRNKIIAGGRLIPKKGLHQLSSVDNLTIFGEGPLIYELQKQMPTARFTEYLEGEQLKDLMNESWLYLFPAVITSDGDSDGIPNTIKEAMLMRLQVIASPVAGIPELENISILSDWSKINQVIEDMPKQPNWKGEQEIRKLYNPKSCINKLLEGFEKYG